MSQNTDDPDRIAETLAGLYRRNGRQVEMSLNSQGQFVLFVDTQQTITIHPHPNRGPDHLAAYSRAVAVGPWYCITQDGPHCQTLHYVPGSPRPHSRVTAVTAALPGKKKGRHCP